MASANLLQIGTVVCDNLIAGTMALPNSCVSNANVSTSAAIAASKMQQQYQPTYGQSGTATSVTIPLHHVRGATASLEAFSAGSIGIAVGAATVTADIRKNGVTCLSAVITLDTGNTTYIAEAGTISVASAVAGDIFTLVIVATAGGGTLPTGLFVSAKFRETAD